MSFLDRRPPAQNEWHLFSPIFQLKKRMPDSENNSGHRLGGSKPSHVGSAGSRDPDAQSNSGPNGFALSPSPCPPSSAPPAERWPASGKDRPMQRCPRQVPNVIQARISCEADPNANLSPRKTKVSGSTKCPTSFNRAPKNEYPQGLKLHSETRA